LNADEINNIIQNIHEKTSSSADSKDSSQDDWASALDQVASYTKDDKSDSSDAHVDAILQELKDAKSHSNGVSSEETDASSDKKPSSSSDSSSDKATPSSQSFREYIDVSCTFIYYLLLFYLSPIIESRQGL
jgi:hypothetical protein